ncbi:hypothetical protein [Cupriavidus sp. TMH.W2]|uniref:hypothetical protein n=1 Tax=Cupriavidus sp. TMH.W2 TaxID=3434465 RepID=UPI003D7831E6
MSFCSGEWVGAGYWANRLSHPDSWGRPMLGRILDPADRRAWANSFEFPESSPDLGQVMSLVIKYKAEGKLDDKVPIEWHFRDVRIVRWELIRNLRSAKDEHVYWRALRSQRLDEINHPRRKSKRPLTEFLPEGFFHLVPA